MSIWQAGRSRSSVGKEQKPHILVGVTSAQTCLVLYTRLKAFRDAGFRVSLISGPGERFTEASRLAGVTSHFVSMKREISLHSDVIAFCRILFLVARLRPDIVVFCSFLVGLLGCAVSWICRVPARVYFLRGLRLETATGLKRYILLWSEKIAAVCAQ